MSATIHLLRETNLLDVPATLRNIADSIERGAYGPANGVAVVLDCDAVEIFYAGKGEAGLNAHLMFNLGAAKILAGVLDEKG